VWVFRTTKCTHAACFLQDYTDITIMTGWIDQSTVTIADRKTVREASRSTIKEIR
jgi:hypothetical protein